MNDVSTQIGGAAEPGDPGPAAPDPGAAAVGPTDRIAALTDAVAQLARSQQALLESLRGDRAGANADGDVRRIVAEVLRERDAARAGSAAREQYLRSKMADLPEAYRRLVPEGAADDVALAAAERDVRRQFREDLRLLGGAIDVAGGAAAAGVPGGAADDAEGRQPGAAVDYSALSPLQQITLGLKAAKPVGRFEHRGPPRPGAPGASTNGAAVLSGTD